MNNTKTVSQALESRLARYALAAGAVVAAVPAQAAPITVILPTPVDIRTGYQLDFDQDNITEFYFSGSGSTALACYFNAAVVLGAGSSNLALSLGTGASFGLSGNTQVWVPSVTMLLHAVTSPTFLAFRFQSTNGGFNRVGFAQFYGTNLYGFAWEEASTLRTFDLSTLPPTTGVPEPATGALTALALGAVALAARKRKQA